MVFNVNKCLTAALLAIAILSVAYIFENGKSNTYAQSSANSCGDIISYNVCLIGDSNVTLSFPLISKKEINSVELVSCEGGLDQLVTHRLDFDKSDVITYNKYKIYSFTITFRNISSETQAYSITVPKIMLKVNDANFTYKTPDFSLCNDAYITNNGEYKLNTDCMVMTKTNTAYYTLPRENNLASFTLHTYKDVTLMSMKAADFFNINDLTINETPTDAQNIYMALKKDHDFNINYSLNYSDYSYSNRIVKSSMIIKYKVDEELRVFVSNIPLYVFPGYSKNYAMERYIDNL